MTSAREYVTAPALRVQLAAYRVDLVRRVRLVVCLVCGARANTPCVTRLGPRTWCHGQRHSAAKRAGHVAGRP